MCKPIKAKFDRPGKILNKIALQRKNTIALARWLLGKTLARRFSDGTVRRVIITETEACHGETDLACHAAKGRTARTAVMYHAGGVWYVYLCYGMHEMLNLVTGPENFPAAILMRAVHGITGPGRLTKALSITRALNGASACDAGDGAQLWLEETPPAARRRARVSKNQIRITPRVGVACSGPVWSAKPWRFVANESTARQKTPSHTRPAMS